MPKIESVVARLGVNVHPDTKGFGEGLKAYLRKKEKERDFQLHVKTKPDDVKAEDLRDMRDRSQKKIDSTHVKFRVPVRPDSDKTMDELRENVKKINAGIESNKNLRLKIPVAVNGVALARELRDALRFAKRMLTDEDRTIQMKVDLDPAKTKEEWRHLKKDLNNDSVDLNVDLDRQGRARAQLALLTRTRFVDLVVRVRQRSVKTAMATLEALSGVGMVRRIGLSIEDFLGDIDKVIFGIGMIGTKIGAVLDMVITASASLVTIAGDLGKLSGFGLFAPTALASIITFTVVGIAAFKNFKSAVNGSNDALAKLPTNARKTALALRGVWASIQQPVQNAFWETFGDGLVNLVQHVFPEFRAGLTGVSGAIGGFANRALDAFTQKGGSGFFKEMFDNLSRGITNASNGVYGLMSGIIGLGSTGSQYLPRLGNYLSDVGNKFNSWVQRAQKSGRIDELIQNAFKAAGNLKTAITGVYNGLKNIASIARGAGFGGLDDLAAGATKFQNITNGKQFKDALNLIFGGAHDGWGKLKTGIADLGSGIATLAPTLSSILTNAGAIVGTLLSGLGEAVKSPIFQKGAKDLFDGMRTGAEKLVKFLPKVSSGFGSLMTISGHAIDKFAPVIGNIFAKLADVLIKLQPTLLTFVDTMSSIVNNGIGMLFATVSTVITPALNILLGIFNKLPGPMQTVVGLLLLLSKYMKGTATDAGTMVAANRRVRDDADRKGLFLSKKSFDGLGTNLRAIPGMFRTAWLGASTVVSTTTIPTPDLTKQFGTGFQNSLKNAATGAINAVNPLIKPVVTKAFLPDSAGMRSYFTSEVSKADLASAVNRAFDSGRVTIIAPSALNRAATTLQSGLARIVPANFRQTVGRVFDGIKASATTAFGAIRSAGSSLFSFLGGGWGVALIAGMLFFSKIQEQRQKLDDIKRAGEDMFKGIAEAASSSAQALDGPAGFSVALGKVREDINSVTGMDANKLFPKTGEAIGVDMPGLSGGNSTLKDWFNKNGFSDEDIAKVGAGRGSEAAQQFLVGLKAKLDSNAGSGLVGWVKQFFSESASQSKQASGKIAPLIEANKRNAEELTKILSDPSKKVGVLQSAMERASREASSSSSGIISSFGSVIDETLSGLSKGQREASGTTDKVKLLAEGVSNAIGASSDQTGVFQTAIHNTVSRLGGDLSKISDADFGKEFAFQANLMGQSDDVVKTALEGIGFSADDASNAIEFRFGTAVDKFGNKIQILGQDIANSPLDGAKGEEMFGGIQKVSDALSAASGIPSNVLSRVFTDNQLNFSTLGPDLAKAGVSLDQIKVALQASGLSDSEIATQLEAARLAAQDLVTKGLANTRAIDDFATALQKVRDTSERVSDGIDGILTAYDRLLGGFKESVNIKDTLQTGIEDTIQGIKDGLDKGDLKTAFKNGFDGPLNKAGRNLLKGLSTDASNYAKGLASAFDAARDAGQGPAEAMQTAITQMKPFAGMIDGVFQQLIDSEVLSATQVDELKTKLGLLPDQTDLLILATTDGALGDIAKVVTEANGLAKGDYTVTVDSLTASAISNIESLGGKVNEVDGKYTVTFGATDKEAKETIRLLKLWATKQKLWIGIDTNINSLKNKIRDEIGHGSQVGSALNGKVLDFFANGGIRKALSGIKLFASGSENHVAQIAPAGSWRVWAEPETGGEAYIPLAASKRVRSLEILNAVAQRFGYALVQQSQMIRRYADGSSGVVNNSTTGHTFNITQNYSGSQSASKAAMTAARMAEMIG